MIAARPPAGADGSQQRSQPGCRDRDRDLREVPATDQAIRPDPARHAAREMVR